jgi:hypothetical protein
LGKTTGKFFCICVRVCIYIYKRQRCSYVTFMDRSKEYRSFQASGNFTPNFRYELLKTLLWLLNVEQRCSFTLTYEHLCRLYIYIHTRTHIQKNLPVVFPKVYTCHNQHNPLYGKHSKNVDRSSITILYIMIRQKEFSNKHN